MSFINGFKKFSGTTVGLMAIGVGSTFILVIGHRFIVRPLMNKKRRLDAEAYADYIFQQESERRQRTT
ncbi:uncharacterized protein LOC115626147 [Scaptodrosophila lebanonensis]|uniref:Uncharacterized protein LOC115626147 n=1 Tax=Drosophila lebanonensis TaxID=7225 RepID=A0A6J2TKZ0_DROLE|nr:uncharacterized protein LOC115626147 [Scaptodrosophila lebanonensis]